MKRIFRKIRVFTSRYQRTAPNLFGQKLVSNIASAFSAGRAILLDSLILVFVISMGVLVIRDLHEDKVAIEKIDVPEEFSKNGFDQYTISKEIVRRILDIREATTTSHYQLRVGSSGDRVDLILPSLGLSFKTVTAYFRSLFGIPGRAVTGRLVKKEKDGLELTLYMTNPAGKETVIFEGREQVNHLKNLICLGAEAVLRNTEPYILADYLLQYEPFLAQEELRSILRDTTFQRDHKWAYVAWGQLLSDAGLYDNALKFYRSALEEDENFEVALNNIGASYSHGKGVLKDHVTAKAYYEKASRNGYTGARYNLGVLMHQDGDQRGIGILEDLANRDDAYALGYLGRKFPQKHLAYLKRAAYLGNKLAQSLLGVFYVLGQYGLPMDLQMASYWLRKGAAGAESLAEFALADIYSAGADRAKLVEAYAWAQVAAIHSSGQEALHQQDLAKKNGIKVKLTDTELSAARDMLIRAGFPADEDPDLSRGDNRFLKMRPFRPDSERGDSCR